MVAIASWPELISAAARVNARLAELEPNSHGSTLPRERAFEATLLRFEAESPEALPPGYRDFLLFADGWEAFYFGMGIFGLPELRGGGNWRAGQELLQTYADEEVLESIGIDMSEVLPIAAGQGLNLIVIYRPGSAAPGQVVWIDCGEEFARFDDFIGCFEFIVDLKRRRLSRIEPRSR